MSPATPEAKKPKYVRRPILPPDSAANVIKQFMRYDPEAAINQASKFENSGDNPRKPYAIEKRAKSTSVFTNRSVQS